MSIRENLLELEKYIQIGAGKGITPSTWKEKDEARKKAIACLNEIRMDIQVIIMERIEVGEIKLVLESQDLKFKKIEILCQAITRNKRLTALQGYLPSVPVAAIREILGLEPFDFKEERKRKRTEERKKLRDNMKICPICQESGGCEHMTLVTDIEDKENDK